MQINYNQVLSNGAIEDLQDSRFVGFIFGALDNGWAVTWPGCVRAKKGKIMAYTYASGGADRHVYFLHGDTKVLQVPINEFQWTDIKLSKGNLYHKDRFIISTK